MLGYRLLICRWVPILLMAVGLLSPLSSCRYSKTNKANELHLRYLDDVFAAWSRYRHTYVKSGRVVSLDEGNMTTSEGQGYAMLRAVWAGDRAAFERIWSWTDEHLRMREHNLFAWKWKGRVLDPNSATDADTDIALALILAGRRFSNPEYERQALPILNAIWNQDVITVGHRYFVAGGNWGRLEEYPKLHVAYLAPYAYEVFAAVDPSHPWNDLRQNSYDTLRWLYMDQQVRVPPEFIYLDRRTGQLHLRHPKTGQQPNFSYDAFPIFWRIALDAQWFHREESDLRQRMLAFFKQEWSTQGRFLDRYDLDGKPLSRQEGLPLYATVHTLAAVEDKALAESIWQKKLSRLWSEVLVGKPAPYYLQNWVWFSRASDLSLTRYYREPFTVFSVFYPETFKREFPWAAFAAMAGLFLFARRNRFFKALFLVPAFYICVRYLAWRVTDSLNFMEPLGPLISISLWLAECYCFVTVLLLWAQVGLGGHKSSKPPRPPMPAEPPSVDVFIPIYQESCDILEKTLIGASAMDYPRKTLYVSDDSHRTEVADMARRYGARYIRGPQQHAKAGNLNHAMKQTDGELLVIFDTDHIPAISFLNETVPFFSEPSVAFVQTPHNFYNEDVFQRTFRLGERIPNEQVMFHHAIQEARNEWNGAFFVGSGALFRRRALEAVSGFDPMSLTEDIHTSQKLHAAGWKSIFVNKDLLAGLNAENFSSYLSQRRRWMLGGLQIFFKDNPLFCRGLNLRQRLGYLASLLYFFFPVARAIICLTPLYYLLFHLHPLLADTTTFTAYLSAYLAALWMLGDVLLPGWPRLFWQELYEVSITFPLFVSMFSLFRKKSMGFKVTPKGVTSTRRTFAREAAGLTGLVALIAALALAKGFFECFYFGVERDAFLLNLGWATYFFVILAASLLVAWESPQRRSADRIRTELPFRLEAGGYRFMGRTAEISLTGFSFVRAPEDDMPESAQVTFQLEGGIRCPARLMYHEKIGRQQYRSGWTFTSVSQDMKEALVRGVFANAKTWEKVPESWARSHGKMALLFVQGIFNYFRAFEHRARKTIRRPKWRWATLEMAGQRCRVLLIDESARGFGGLLFGKPVPAAEGVLRLGETPDHVRRIYVKPLLPRVQRVGLVA